MKKVRGLESGQRAALLISECQQAVVGSELALFPNLVQQVSERGIIPRIARLTDEARSHGLPVIHLHVVHRPGYIDLPMTSVIVAQSAKAGRMIAGSRDVEAIPELAPQVEDIVHARSFSLVSFHGTDLDAILRNMGIQTLILAGVSTNVAISGTALCGSDLGYQIVVAEDCIAGASPETHQFICQNLLPLYSTVTDSDSVISSLQQR